MISAFQAISSYIALGSSLTRRGEVTEKRGDGMGRPSFKWHSSCSSTVGLLCVPDKVTIKADTNSYGMCVHWKRGLLDESLAMIWLTWISPRRECMGSPRSTHLGKTIFKVIYWEEFLGSTEGSSLMKLLLIYWEWILKTVTMGLFSCVDLVSVCVPCGCSLALREGLGLCLRLVVGSCSFLTCSSSSCSCNLTA